MTGGTMSNLVQGRVGIATQTPGDDVYHLLTESSNRSNAYTTGYKSLCNMLTEKSTLVVDTSRSDLSEYRLCGHCRKQKQRIYYE